MPYVIVAVIIVVASVAFFVLRSPAEAPSTPTTNDVAPVLAPGEVPVGFVEPTEPPPGQSTSRTETAPEITQTIEPGDLEVSETSNDFDPADDQRTFSAEASYFTPRRTEHEMLISLTLKDRVVVGVNVDYDGGVAGTPNHIAFDKAYKSEVIGKRLNEINLSRVGGASLTSTAFNEAVAEIRGQL